MKVLYVVNIPAPYRMEFFHELGKLCELTVLAEASTSSDRNPRWFHGSAQWNFHFEVLPSLHLGKNLVFCPSILKCLSKEKFDLVILGVYSTPTQMLASLWLRLMGRPYALNSDGGFIKQESPLAAAVKRFFISSAAWWLSSGEGTDRYLRHYGAAAERIHPYPFTSLSQKDTLPESPGRQVKELEKGRVGINGKLVLSVGTFEHRKGFDRLLEAWKELDSEGYTLALIGGGPEKERYEAIIRSRGLQNVRLVDFLDRAGLLAWYRAADLFVLPTRYDIWGLVVNEALSQALPVVSTDGALAARELVKDGINGFVTGNGDMPALVDRVRRILEDDGLREAMSHESVKSVKAYTIENMAAVHAELFQHIGRGGVPVCRA